jgi:hypothetical protein
MAISAELANELKTALGRLREARWDDPKHGTIAGAPDCDDRCQVCFNECYFDYLVDQIPRPPQLAVNFVAPWPIVTDGV